MQDKDQIEACYREMYRGMVERDRTARENVFADDFVLVHMTGTRQSGEEYMEAVMSEKIRYPSAKHEKIEVAVNGSKATVVGQTIVEAVTAGGSNTWPLQMDIDLTKINGQWKMREVRTSTYK